LRSFLLERCRVWVIFKICRTEKNVKLKGKKTYAELLEVTVIIIDSARKLLKMIGLDAASFRLLGGQILFYNLVFTEIL